MRIDKIDNTSFQAGNLKFLNVAPECFVNSSTLKEIAVKTNMDITIYKKDGEKFFKNYDMYFVQCTKVLKNYLLPLKQKPCHRMGLTIHPKNIVPKTLSENIYNIALETAENFDKFDKDNRLSTKLKNKFMDLLKNSKLYLARQKFL